MKMNTLVMKSSRPDWLDEYNGVYIARLHNLEFDVTALVEHYRALQLPDIYGRLYRYIMQTEFPLDIAAKSWYY